MKDKQLVKEATEMLQDSKAKIEYIKMRIMKVKQSTESSQHDGSGGIQHNNKQEKGRQYAIH